MFETIGQKVIHQLQISVRQYRGNGLAKIDLDDFSAQIMDLHTYKPGMTGRAGMTNDRR
jgi:hypothetical protein